MSALKFAACGGTPLYVDDVFSAYTRTGTGASATVTTGIDLSTYGGMVWPKSRSAATGHRLMHTAIGVGNKLVTDTTAASAAAAQGVTAVSTTGHTIGTDTDYNNSTGPATYVDWTFRNATKFYTHSVVTKSAGSNATVDLSTLGTVGMVRVKRTDLVGSWYIWHRSLTAGMLLIGETTAAEATLGHITVSGTTVTLVNGVIADGTYLVEAFAHDTSATGIIQCGSFTTDGSGNASVTLGWEPQYLMVKCSSNAENWYVMDSARNFSVTNFNALSPNTSTAEAASYTGFVPNATGFTRKSGSFGGPTWTYTYLAIRRPNKPPTSGTQVYNAIARTGTGAAATVTGVGFAPDLGIFKKRAIIGGSAFNDRLRGTLSKVLSTDTTAEGTNTDTLLAFTPDGYSLGIDSLGMYNYSGLTHIHHLFRRAPRFFDEVCYTGTGANKTEYHNLTVAPELWIVKGRSGVTAWTVGCTALVNTEYLVLNTTTAKATDATAWNSTFPTASVFSLGTQATVNTSAATYVAYLFATLAGISKVGSYTGDGTTGKAIACGFAAGARFILIKRTDSTGDWFVFDSVRTYPAGNDYHLSLNTTATEVVTTDDVDYDAAGFLVNQNATTNLNVTSATYIFLAIA